MPLVAPGLPTEPPPPPPEPLVVTDEHRRAVLAEAKLHCAPSTFLRFVRSLAANTYPLDVTTL